MNVIRYSMIALAVFLTSSKPYDIRLTYTYNLTQMKNARSPEKIRLVQPGDIGRDKSIISDGMLFTYKNRKAETVWIAGNFSSWKLKMMTRSREGVWFYFLPNTEFHGKIEYKFNIDGQWTEDPLNIFKEDDRRGSYISTAEIGAPEDGKFVTYKLIADRHSDRKSILFRTYRPAARMISLVGDFNGWNPEHDLMARGADGIWRLEKRLPSGVYRYKFIVDGEWVPDLFNPDSASDAAGDICSVIKIR